MKVNYDEDNNTTNTIETTTIDGNTTTPPTLPPGFRHERQYVWDQLCLMHAINNMFLLFNLSLGEEEEGHCNNVTKRDLDKTCEKLVSLSSSSSPSWFNPHRSLLGLGNYDVNVAIYILQDQYNLSVEWFDGRKSVESLIPFLLEDEKKDNVNFAQVVGFLINVQAHEWVPSWTPILGGGRHWITIGKQQSRNSNVNHIQWWQLDSRQNEPLLLKDIVDSMKHHLSKGNHIFIVTKKLEKESPGKVKQLATA